MKMLLGNVNMGAANGSLEVLPKVFKTVDMRCAFHIFSCAVVHGLVLVALFGQAFVGVKFIRVNRGTLNDVLLDKRLQGSAADIRNNFRYHLPVALQHPENDCLVRRAAPSLASAEPADIGFIGFNLAEQGKLAVNVGNVLADNVSHTPRGFVGNAKLPFQFFCGYAMTGSCVKVDCIEPKLQGCAGVLERSARGRMDMMSAPLAGIGSLGLEAEPVALAVTLWAHATLSKSDIEDVLQARFIGRELLEKLPDGDAHFRFIGLYRFHGANIC